MCAFGRLRPSTTGSLSSALCSIGRHTWPKRGGIRSVKTSPAESGPPLPASLNDWLDEAIETFLHTDVRPSCLRKWEPSARCPFRNLFGGAGFAALKRRENLSDAEKSLT